LVVAVAAALITNSITRPSVSGRPFCLPEPAALTKENHV
jgi:hypothetical protein